MHAQGVAWKGGGEPQVAVPARILRSVAHREVLPHGAWLAGGPASCCEGLYALVSCLYVAP